MNATQNVMTKRTDWLSEWTNQWTHKQVWNKEFQEVRLLFSKLVQDKKENSNWLPEWSELYMDRLEIGSANYFSNDIVQKRTAVSWLEIFFSLCQRSILVELSNTDPMLLQ